MSRADEDEPILPPESEAELLAALEAALRPQPLSPETNERLLALALEEPLAPPSAEELIESARLRDALAGGEPHDSAELLGALRAPFASSAEDTIRVERALERAFESRAPTAKGARGRVIYAWFGAGSVALAAAAAIALLVAVPRRQKPEAAAAPALVRPHTTVDLFSARFETSATTERMDLIASARLRDLRDNRYAAWGVR